MSQMFPVVSQMFLRCSRLFSVVSQEPQMFLRCFSDVTDVSNVSLRKVCRLPVVAGAAGKEARPVEITAAAARCNYKTESCIRIRGTDEVQLQNRAVYTYEVLQNTYKLHLQGTHEV